MVTSLPVFMSRRATWEPIKPVPPMRRACIARGLEFSPVRESEEDADNQVSCPRLLIKHSTEIVRWSRFADACLRVIRFASRALSLALDEIAIDILGRFPGQVVVQARTAFKKRVTASKKRVDDVPIRG